MNETTLYKRVLTPGILLLLAYEWLISGFDKVFSGIFVQQLRNQLVSSLSGLQYHFYDHFLKSVVVPQAHLFAVLVEIGEICTGIGFVALAVALIRDRMNSVLALVGIWTSIISAFMALNFFLWQGGSLFLNPSDPFDEGITIDLMLVLIQLWMAIFFFSVRRKFAAERQHALRNSYSHG
ncbi:hypothetical protein [Alicyclobacillus acidiphilus]|uniref:hypothetical protein n=1 Tax=Alicyclobacillus acidiphilus TaxID=182455 RepID=UPI00082B7157|nr:hypothetical protein [Alicyclobacillus acidiphilus]